MSRTGVETREPCSPEKWPQKRNVPPWCLGALTVKSVLRQESRARLFVLQLSLAKATIPENLAGICNRDAVGGPFVVRMETGRRCSGRRLFLGVCPIRAKTS